MVAVVVDFAGVAVVVVAAAAAEIVALDDHSQLMKGGFV